MTYFLSWVFDLGNPFDKTATLDEAFHRAAKATSPRSIVRVVVWNWDGKQRHYRAFAKGGVATWAQPCPKCTKPKTPVVNPCSTCNGWGALP